MRRKGIGKLTSTGNRTVEATSFTIVWLGLMSVTLSTASGTRRNQVQRWSSNDVPRPHGKCRGDARQPPSRLKWRGWALVLIPHGLS